MRVAPASQEVRGRAAATTEGQELRAYAKKGGRVRADPATRCAVGQLAEQVTAGVAALPLPMKPNVVLAPAPSRPL
ncbi:hypothetical protein TPA0908_10250 [Micromonospora sp. AKA38]|nr:hypothetical protein TPA0908_10250 [Micromonospora sp. AKA38]